jgi:hypothetical protein
MANDNPITPENTLPTHDESPTKSCTVPNPSTKKDSHSGSEKKSKNGRDDKRQRRASPNGDCEAKAKAKAKPPSSTYRPNYNLPSRDGRLWARSPRPRRNDNWFRDNVDNREDRHYRALRSPRPPTPRATRDDYPYHSRPLNEYHNDRSSRHHEWTWQSQTMYGSA